MDSQEMGPKERLLKQFGSISAIPENELQSAKLLRFFSKRTESYSLISEKEYTEKLGPCIHILHNYNGYIFAHDLENIILFCKKEENLNFSLLGKIKTRAEEFIAAEIPPIFKNEFNTISIFEYTDFSAEEDRDVTKMETFFPSVDFIIQFATGAYDKKRVAIAKKFRNTTGSDIPKIAIQPATVDDVLNFRKVAFTPDGKIITLLIRETAAYVRSYFVASNEKSAEYHEDVDKMVFLYLEEMLKDVAVETQNYREWDGDIDVVGLPRWYLPFSAEDRTKIANAYFSQILIMPKGKDRATFKKMKILFPEMAEGVEQKFSGQEQETIDQKIEKAIQNAEETENFSHTPEQAFMEEPWRSKFLPRIEKFFIESCAKILKENPEAFFISITEFHTKVRVPKRLPVVPHFRNLLNGFRLEAAKNLTDEQIKLLFMGERGGPRLNSIGIHRDGDFGQTTRRSELRTYLQGRVDTLKQG